MVETFLQSVIAQPPVILTRRLRPFSVGHFTLLRALDSPFALGGTVHLKDALLALEICSRSFEDARAWLHEATLESVARESAEQGKRSGPVDLHDLVGRIDKYMRLYTSVPKFWRSGQESQSKLPESLILVSVLMGKCGMSESAAWSCPYGMAVWYVTAANERGEAIVSEDEQYVIDNYDAVINRLKGAKN